jgi:hypothetical protein
VTAAFVKVTELRSGASNAASGSVASTAGNALFVGSVAYYSGALANPSLVVSGGGTWTIDKRDDEHFSATNDDIIAGWASCPSAPGGTQTITVTWGTGFAVTAFVFEFSGMVTAQPMLDVAGAGNQNTTGSPITAPSLTSLNAADVFLSICSIYGASSANTPTSTGTGWTQPAGTFPTIGYEQDNTAFVASGTGYKIVSSAGPQQQSWTVLNGPTAATALSVCYKQAAGGGPTTTPITASTTQAQAVTLRKQANLARPITQTQVATARKTTNLVRATSQSQTATGAALKVIVRVLSVTQSQVATFSKQVAVVRTVAQPQSLSVAKQLTLKRGLTQAQTLLRTLATSLRRSTSQPQTATSVTTWVPPYVAPPPLPGSATPSIVGAQGVTHSSSIAYPQLRIVAQAQPAVGSARKT